MVRFWPVLAAGWLVACTGPTGTDDDPVPTDGTHASDATDATDDTDDPGGGKTYDELLFECDGEPSSSPARLRRTNRQEWTRSIGQGLGSLADTNPFDPPSSLPYSTYSDGVSVDPASLDLYLNVAHLGGASWTEREARGSGVSRLRIPYEDGGLKCMWTASSPDEACIDYYVGTLLEKGVLFRPPTDEEFDQLRAFAVQALNDEGGAPRAQTLGRVTTAAWLSSGALFRAELGTGMPDEHDRHRLGDWELARMVSQMISDRPMGTTATFRYQQGPDGSSWTAPPEGYLDQVLAAAQDGSIQDPATLRALVRTYAAGIDPERYDLNMEFGEDRRARRGEYWMSHKLEQFFAQWLEVESFPNEFKDTPHKTSLFDGNDTWKAYNLNASYGNLQSGYYGQEPLLLQQLTDSIARVVVEDEDVLRTLLTTRRFYVAANAPYSGSSISKSTEDVNRVYGITYDVQGTRESRWVELPAGERSGVLTHPAWLAAHGDNFEDGASLVLRGRWVRENLLCQDVPGLESVMVEAQLQPSDGSKSARQRVEEDIETRTECMACHDRMNSLGKPFEAYNHAGFVRATDHGSDPDGSTVVQDAVEGNFRPDLIDGAYDGPVDFTAALADSPHVKRCFIRHTFRFFMGRDETRDDACTLTAMEQAYDDSGGSFIEMLGALATSDAALYRHVPEGGGG